MSTQCTGFGFDQLIMDRSDTSMRDPNLSPERAGSRKQAVGISAECRGVERDGKSGHLSVETWNLKRPL
jgi:hypothetical protein